ncbi:MAG: outer membrane protein transport protein [Gammaproteobacteria bacterium]|nr:outer membrane protein transport protein [Gammaproteobacteria bacterium]
MINKNLKLVTALGCALGIATPASVFATNGMFMIGYGNKSRGMGGVGITMTHDTLASAANPATMAFIKGNQFDIGGDIFKANAEASLGEDGVYLGRVTVESKPDHMALADGLYMMPSLGASWNKGDLSYGFTMVPVGGGGSRYEPNIYNSVITGAPTDEKMGVSLMVMNINPTIAYKLDENNSVGATLIIGAQVFKSYGLSYFQTFTESDSPDHLTDQGADIAYGAGIRLGWMGKFMENKLSLGAEFTSQTYMSKFDDYSELFAGQGELNTPGNIGLGASYQFMDDLTVALDINYIMYEDIPAIANLGPGQGTDGALYITGPETNQLGLDEGLGFGWGNQTVIKLGVVYAYDTRWTLRGGWNYAKSPIHEERDILFSMVAPATTEHHLTLGATYQYDKDIELNFSYGHAFENTQWGPTYIGGSGEISMSTDALGASLSMKF